MAPLSVRAEPGSLHLRVISAVVLAPVALGAVWAGGLWLTLLTAAAAGLMAAEWTKLCSGGRFGAEGVLLVAAVVLAAAVAGAGYFGPALAVAGAGAAIVLGICGARGCAAPRLLAFGALYIGVPCVSILWLSADPATGRAVLFWILALVWATDIGAYAFGRTIGGPKLAPRVSPKKTWAGLIGGVASAAVAGLATAHVANAPSAAAVVAVSAGLAVIEQFGDLAESAVKRRFGVKDAGTLIPGHGGMLDRLDGLLAVAPAVALLSLIGGSSVLIWR